MGYFNEGSGLDLSKENMELGKTLDNYRKVSVALNSFEKNREISIEDLAKKAGVHWNTAKKAIILFSIIEPITPKFQMESKSKFKITEKPDAIEAVDGIFSSPNMRILVKLILQNSTEEKNAKKLEDLGKLEKQVLQELISNGFINSIEGRFYLSKKGQSLASIGLRELVNMGIELPWEKEVRKAHFSQIEGSLEGRNFYITSIQENMSRIWTKSKKTYPARCMQLAQNWQSFNLPKRENRKQLVFC